MIKIGNTSVEQIYHVLEEKTKGKVEPVMVKGKPARVVSPKKAQTIARSLEDPTKAVIVLQETKQTTFILEKRELNRFKNPFKKRN